MSWAHSHAWPTHTWVHSLTTHARSTWSHTHTWASWSHTRSTGAHARSSCSHAGTSWSHARSTWSHTWPTWSHTRSSWSHAGSSWSHAGSSRSHARSSWAHPWSSRTHARSSWPHSWHVRAHARPTHSLIHSRASHSWSTRSWSHAHTAWTHSSRSHTARAPRHIARMGSHGPGTHGSTRSHARSHGASGSHSPGAHARRSRGPHAPLAWCPTGTHPGAAGAHARPTGTHARASRAHARRVGTHRRPATKGVAGVDRVVGSRTPHHLGRAHPPGTRPSAGITGVAVGRVLAGASLLLGVASGLRTRGNPEVSPRPLVAHGVSLHCLLAVMSKLRQEASRIQASRDRLDLSTSIHTWVRIFRPTNTTLSR